MTRLLAIALLALPTPALAQQVGDTVQILRQHQVSQQSQGSSSTSSNTDAMIERVTAVSADGVELEYDVPQGSGGGGWQFPVRVFRPAHGRLRLVNAKELEARVDTWLQQLRLKRAACGTWIPSWEAVLHIECDPRTVLQTIEGLQVEPPVLREGAPFSMAGARGSALLAKKGDRRFVAELAVDPDAVRKERADSDIAMAAMEGHTMTQDSARRVRAGEAISGTITVTFDLDDSGHAGRKTMVRKVEIKGADGRVETQIVTEILERQPKAKPPRDPNLI